MLRRDDAISHAETGVRSRGEHPQVQVLLAFDGKIEFGAFGSADPMALHGLDALWPLQGVQSLQELIGVGRDPEEPLLEIALDHEIARTVEVPSGRTCSFASTVWQPGHQLTRAIAR